MCSIYDYQTRFPIYMHHPLHLTLLLLLSRLQTIQDLLFPATHTYEVIHEWEQY